MKQLTSRNMLEMFGLFVLSLTVFLWGVAGSEVIGFDSRFYLFALEMWRHGFSWFPTTYHQSYPDYPGTSTWLIYLSASFLGQLDKLAAVIPTAIAGALTVVVTYCIGNLREQRWGFFAALMMLLTFAFVKAGRSISLDMYPTLLTAAAFYVAYSADVLDKQGRIGWLFVLFFLGFAFRGPIGLIVPTGVVCAYYLLDYNYRRLFFVGMFSLLILVLASFVLLGLAKAAGGDAFVQQVIRMQAFGRIESSKMPYYFYLQQGLINYALSFPLALLVGLGAVYYFIRLSVPVRIEEFKLLVKLLGWALVVVVGLSIPGDKKIRYIMPIAPALALMAAYPFVCSSKDKYFVFLHRCFFFIIALLPTFLLATLAYFIDYASKNALSLSMDYHLLGYFLVAVQAAVIVVYYCSEKKWLWREPTIMLFAVLSFVTMYINLAERVELYIDRTREMVVHVETLRHRDQAQLVFYRENPDSLPIKYLINMWAEETPYFVYTPQALSSYPNKAYFVTSAAYFGELSPDVTAAFHVVAVDQIGHVPVVVFAN